MVLILIRFVFGFSFVERVGWSWKQPKRQTIFGRKWRDSIKTVKYLWRTVASSCLPTRLHTVTGCRFSFDIQRDIRPIRPHRVVRCTSPECGLRLTHFLTAPPTADSNLPVRSGWNLVGKISWNVTGHAARGDPDASLQSTSPQPGRNDGQ